MSYTAKDGSGNVLHFDGNGTGADAGNAIKPNATLMGLTNETAPASDTAASGLNGRLQRIAQRLTSLIALLPTALGQNAKANSLSVTLASDQGALPITDNSGSLTVDGSVAATQSGAWDVGTVTTITNVVHVDDNADSLTVDGAVSISSALPAGTNAIGKLAANSGVDIGDVDVTSIAAGETHIGHVTGGGIAIKVAPTVSAASAYTSGDSIGGKFTLADAVRVSGGVSTLAGIHILDRANQKPGGTLILYDADPTNATLTDNAALANSTDDLKVIAIIPVSSGDYTTIDSKAYAALSGLGWLVQAASGTSLYASWVTTSTPTFAATDDIQLIFTFTYAN